MRIHEKSNYYKLEGCLLVVMNYCFVSVQCFMFALASVCVFLEGLLLLMLYQLLVNFSYS